LGMAKVHERAVQEGVVVLLDGNGLDEGWAGYEYYQRAAQVDVSQAPVQGSRDPSTRPECLNPDFAALAVPPPSSVLPALPFAPDASRSALLAFQYRGLGFA